MGKKDIYIVRRPFIANGRQVIRRGTRLLGDSPLIKGNEHLMVIATDGFAVESATAAPGERRNVTKPDKEPTKAKIAEALEEA